MKLSLEPSAGINIRAYGPGHITLALPHARRDGPHDAGGDSHIHSLETVTTSVILTPTRMFTDWPPQRYDEIRPDHFEPVIALEPEVVIFGSGRRLRFPPPAIGQRFTSHGIGIEAMDTAAACRTFNILMSEGRHVVAALLMIETEGD